MSRLGRPGMPQKRFNSYSATSPPNMARCWWKRPSTSRQRGWAAPRQSN